LGRLPWGSQFFCETSSLAMTLECLHALSLQSIISKLSVRPSVAW